MIRIGPLQVDLASRELLLDGQPVRIGSRAFDMLAVLIAAKGELVSKNDMLKQIWPDTIVEENNPPPAIGLVSDPLPRTIRRMANYRRTR